MPTVVIALMLISYVLFANFAIARTRWGKYGIQNILVMKPVPKRRANLIWIVDKNYKLSLLLLSGTIVGIVTASVMVPQAYAQLATEIVFDKEEYTPFDEVIASIISPNSNQLPDATERINGTVSSSSQSLGTRSFQETGPNTGIFVQAFKLTPNKKQFPGDLLAIRGDGVTVTFRIDGDTLTKSVFINYHVGQVMFDKDEFRMNERGVLRAIDPDANSNPDTIDTLDVRFWSTTDNGGLKITLRETGDRTGMFEEIVTFTPNEESRGTSLRVSEGDTITAKYTDNTLPAPAALDANKVFTIEVQELFATALIIRKDTVGPVLNIPLPIVLEATGRTGAVIKYTVTTDDIDGPITPICIPHSGSMFPLGVNIVTCSATDSSGNRTEKSFTITVQDTTPPKIIPPRDITVKATGTFTNVSLGTAMVSDLVDPSPIVANNAPVQFPIGTTIVTWRATDFSGNSATVTQSVIVIGNLPPIAMINALNNAIEGSAMEFSAAGSYDPEDFALDYEWDFGDGRGGVGTMVTHAYSDNGIYDVVLTVTDNDGLKVSSSKKIHILNEPPRVTNFIADRTSVQVGDTIHFQAQFDDPGEFDTYTVEWYLAGEDPIVIRDTSSKFQTVEYTYSHPANYIVTLVVKDDDGGIGKSELKISVQPHANTIIDVIEENPWIPLAIGGPPSTIVGLQHVHKPLPKQDIFNGVIRIRLAIRFEIER